MRIVIAGSSGLIGTALVRSLVEDDHEVVRLVRTPGDAAVPTAGSPTTDVAWEPGATPLDPGLLAGSDAVVNLCGHSIGARRWSHAERALLRSSRLDPTATLARALAESTDGPQVFLSASAIGWYGDRGDEELTESSPGGEGFLARLCEDWETATRPAADAGVRTVTLRTGLVLADGKGFLQRPLQLFRLGLGGRIGSGDQWWSWITLADHIRAIRFLAEHPTGPDGDPITGPVNLTAPNPERNRTFTSALGRVLGRPTFMAVPAAGPRLLLGRDLADEVVLAGQRVLPRALTAAGFTFHDPDLEPALERVLGR